VGDAVSIVERPDHGVSSRLVFDAILVDHGLVAKAQEAPQLIASLRESLAEIASR
jgi:hypothetical protein